MRPTLVLAQVSTDGLPIFGLVVAAIIILFVLGFLAFVAKLYRKVQQGQALIVNKPGGTKVFFTGSIVVPLIHRAEYMDISVKAIEIGREGHDGLICKDNIRADIRVTFFVRVNETEDDVKRVAKMVGCARASDQATIEELFGAKFSEALKTAGKQFEFEELYQARQEFRDLIISTIGDDLNGYTLEDVAIDYLEQTRRDSLDPHNILDAEGIRKITERTEEQRVRTNELSNSANKKIGKDDLETKMAMLEYERQQSDAEARQRREIEIVRSTQRAEAEQEKARQLALERKAQLRAEEEVNIQAINKKREEQIAEKSRERAIILEQESIEKEKDLKIIEREREVEVQRIQKERQLEGEKREIAEVVRDRIAVEKNVAQEEENIKDLRVLADAERTKKAVIVRAEGEAQQKLVVDIKAAEANEEVAKYTARQRIIEADAQLDSADRVAKAKIRTAEGIQAEQAAEGLARVRVAEAEANVVEKRGFIEAKVLKEKMSAEAVGAEEQGLVQVRLRQANADARQREGEAEADVKRGTMIAEAAGAEEQGMVEIRIKQARAEAIEREGLAEAKVIRERLLAEAEGSRQKGLSDAQVKEALAAAIEKQGMAEAVAMREKLLAEAEGIEKKNLADAAGIRERLIAEATGLEQKAAAMKQLDDYSRQHEEFRLALEHERAITMEQLRTNIDMAASQAAVYAEAFKAANINIVGGDEGFYKNFLGSVSLGHTLDGFVSNSSTARGVLDRLGINTSAKPGQTEAGDTKDAAAPKQSTSVVSPIPNPLAAAEAVLSSVTGNADTQDSEES